MSTVPDITQEQIDIISEINKILNKITATIDKLPDNVKDLIKIETDTFIKEYKSFDDAFISYNNK